MNNETETNLTSDTSYLKYKIGYDAKRAFFNNTGLGNYSRWLIKAMAHIFPQNSYYLYTPKVKANSRLNFLHNSRNLHIIAPSSRFLTSLWRTIGIVRDLERDGINLYHGLSHELPAGIAESKVKSVVTVHDLIFMRFPMQFGVFNYLIYKSKLRYACEAADKIIAISEKTKADVVGLLKITPDKIKVIYQGCDPIFSEKQTTEELTKVKEQYNLPAKFILSVGTIEQRKNLLLIAMALAGVPDDVFLVVVGRPTKYIEKVKAYLTANNLLHRVIFLHDVLFYQLPAIYRQAAVFVYPSRYEGFGIPVLEALNCGAPVIAATGSCLEEAGGPHSLYVDPDDAAGLTSAINKVMVDEVLRSKMIQEGLLHAAEFTDEKLSLQLNELYINTLNNA